MRFHLRAYQNAKFLANCPAAIVGTAALLASCGSDVVPITVEQSTIMGLNASQAPIPETTPVSVVSVAIAIEPVAQKQSSSITGAAQIGDRLDRTGFNLVFSDEFESLDRDRWRTFWFFGDPGSVSSRRNLQPSLNADDIVVDDAFTVGGGTVKINVRRNLDRSDPRYDNAAFLTGTLTTETSFKQKYGYFEARFSAPKESGLWPAFWLYDAPVPDTRRLPAYGTSGRGDTRNWRDVWSGGLDGEIDIVELLTNKPTSSWHTASARYRWAAGEGGERVRLSIPSDTTEADNATSATSAQTYGVLWTSNTIRFYRNDVLVAQGPNRGLHQPMYMILSMGTGGWNNNKPTEQFNSAVMTIDYVRAYAVNGVN